MHNIGIINDAKNSYKGHGITALPHTFTSDVIKYKNLGYEPLNTNVFLYPSIFENETLKHCITLYIHNVSFCPTLSIDKSGKYILSFNKYEEVYHTVIFTQLSDDKLYYLDDEGKPITDNEDNKVQTIYGQLNINNLEQNLEDIHIYQYQIIEESRPIYINNVKTIIYMKDDGGCMKFTCNNDEIKTIQIHTINNDNIECNIGTYNYDITYIILFWNIIGKLPKSITKDSSEIITELYGLQYGSDAIELDYIII